MSSVFDLSALLQFVVNLFTTYVFGFSFTVGTVTITFTNFFISCLLLGFLLCVVRSFAGFGN